MRGAPWSCQALAPDDDIGVAEIRGKARRLRTRPGDLALDVVDYVQLIVPTPGTAPENRQAFIAFMQTS